MSFEIEKKNPEHSLSLASRKELKISGITQIISFDESYVLLSTVMGEIEISGRELKVDALDHDTCYSLIRGEINGINYIDDSQKKKKYFWNR